MSDIAPASVFVFLEHGLALESWGRGQAEANAPSPYGYSAAADIVKMSWSVDSQEVKAQRVMRKAVRRILGFDFVHAWRNRAGIAAADVIWTHTENEHLAVSLVLLMLRSRKPKIIAQSVWLWDKWDRLSSLRRMGFLTLLERASVEITLSDVNRDRAQREQPGRAILRIPFGAAVNARVAERALAEVAPRSGGYVFAIGSDAHRDWRTLLDAARMLPQVRFRVATMSPTFPVSDAPPNVEVTPARDLEECYRLYVAASVVVLPLRANMHASGCTVAIEAQSLGAPLVTADVGGIGPYLGDQGVWRYEVGDALSLADGIAKALSSPEPGTDPNFIRRSGLTAEDYAARMVVLTGWLVEGGDLPTRVESFTSFRQLLDRPR